MKNHKGFRRIICVTILCALLMVSMGRATRVSAVGTTAAIAGTAFILTGAVYLSYIALTQGEMVLPAAEEIHDWLGGIGRKVSQYPSGAEAYQEIYQGLLKDPTADVIDGVWTWTEDRIKSFVNDFSDTRIINNISSYIATLDITQIPTNGFDYPNVPRAVDNKFMYNGNLYDLTTISTQGTLNLFNGEPYYYDSGGITTIVHTNITTPVRNVFYNNVYYPETLVNGVWQRFSTVNLVGTLNTFFGVRGFSINTYDYYNINSYEPSDVGAGVNTAIPYFPQAPIYIRAEDRYEPLIEVAEGELVTPNWNDPDNENRPIIPWVPIPDIPTGVPVPPGYTGPPTWGFPLAELLDLLEELAENLIKIDAIARLINDFAGQHGDNYYLEYNVGDTNYYTYYQPTIFDNDNEYVTYNIDVSEQEDVIPVDLNTISLYTNNNYLDEVKDAAHSFGSVIGEYVAFWHNCDPVVTYTILGSFVLILLGAFIGKWGHS